LIVKTRANIAFVRDSIAIGIKTIIAVGAVVATIGNPIAIRVDRIIETRTNIVAVWYPISIRIEGPRLHLGRLRTSLTNVIGWRVLLHLRVRRALRGGPR
jgi:hypothetical protein